MALSQRLLSNAVDCALLVHSCKYLILLDYIMGKVCSVRVFLFVPIGTEIELLFQNWKNLLRQPHDIWHSSRFLNGLRDNA